MSVDFTDPYVQIIIAVITGLTSIILGLQTAKARRPDAVTALTDSAIRLLDETQKELERLRSRVTEIESRLDSESIKTQKLLRGVRKLVAQITELGHLPVWTPEEDDSDKKKPLTEKRSWYR